MKSVIVIIEESGKVLVRSVRALSLSEMQEIVGGYIESVPSVIPDIVLLCDEEGKLKKKDVNRIATALYDGYSDCVCGDCLLMRALGERLVPLNERELEMVKEFIELVGDGKAVNSE